MGLFNRRRLREQERIRAKIELDEDGSYAASAAFEAKKKGNYDEAFPLYVKAADKGNLDAIFGLAECYEFGRGVAKDLESARKYYEKSLNGKQTWDIYSRVALYRILSDESYPGYDYSAAYAYLNEAVGAERRSGKYYYNAHYYLAIHYARQNKPEEMIKDALMCAFCRDTRCNMDPRIIKRDIKRYGLPVFVGMCEHMVCNGDTEAVIWLIQHFTSCGKIEELQKYSIQKGFVKSIDGRYYAAKSYLKSLELSTGDIENYGWYFWAHYMALRHWDLISPHDIREKYSQEYKRIKKEGWEAERKDMDVYDKVFDKKYTMKAFVGPGCTKCEKCKSPYFADVNGKMSVNNMIPVRDCIYGGSGTADESTYIKTSITEDKYKILYYARECPAQCIKWDMYINE